MKGEDKMKDRIVRFVLIINFVSLLPFSVQAVESGIDDAQYLQDDGVTGENLMEMAGDVLYAKGGLMDTVQKLREAVHGFLEGEKILMSHFAIEIEGEKPCQISFRDYEAWLPPFAKLSSAESPYPDVDECETESQLRQVQMALFQLGAGVQYAQIPIGPPVLRGMRVMYRAVKPNPAQASHFFREMMDDTLQATRSSIGLTGMGFGFGSGCLIVNDISKGPGKNSTFVPDPGIGTINGVAVFSLGVGLSSLSKGVTSAIRGVSIFAVIGGVVCEVHKNF